MKKRIFSLLLTAVLCLTVLSGCEEREYEVEGNFLYLIQKVTDGEGNEREEAHIYGLSEVGKEQKIIVLPETISSRPVTKVGQWVWFSTIGQWESEKLEKVIFPYEVDYAKNVLEKCPNIKKIITIPVSTIFTDFEVRDDVGLSIETILMNSSYRYHTPNELSAFLKENNVLSKNMCDVSYMYNYEGAPNYGYYWVDDYDNETIEYIPNDPVREGYAFGGWYKEPECVNAWDFENDIVPEKEFCQIEGHKGINVYKNQEVILYAKWISG